MIYMLDTNILIYIMKKRPKIVAKRANALSLQHKLVMSFVTHAELLKGIGNSTKKQASMALLDDLMQIVDVVYPTDGKISEHYAEQFLQLKAKGTPIGNNDLWIACHALAVGAVLVTHNVKEFERIAGLTVEDWVSE